MADEERPERGPAGAETMAEKRARRRERELEPDMPEPSVANGYDIHIVPGRIGFAVTVGCWTFYTSNGSRLSEIAHEYFHDPNGTIRKYQKDIALLKL